ANRCNSIKRSSRSSMGRLRFSRSKVRSMSRLYASITGSTGRSVPRELIPYYSTVGPALRTPRQPRRNPLPDELNLARRERAVLLGHPIVGILGTTRIGGAELGRAVGAGTTELLYKVAVIRARRHRPHGARLFARRHLQRAAGQVLAGKQQV